jgi:ribonuclease HI
MNTNFKLGGNKKTPKKIIKNKTSRKKTSRRKTSRRKTSRRKTSRRKTSRKKTSRRKTSRRKTSRRKTSRKKTSRRKTSRRKTNSMKISCMKITNTKKLTKSNKNTINVYTDGSTLNNCRRSYNSFGGIGVFFDKNDERNISEPFFIHPVTNNRCELYACIRAIQQIINFNKYIKKINVNIYTDSEYVINSLTTWIIMWKKRGWKTAEGKTPKNVDLIYWFDKILFMNKNLLINFIHVKAHRNKPNNENNRVHWNGNKYADKLAKKGMIISKKLIKC